MKRVLHLLHYPGNGGSEKYVYDIISEYGPKWCVFVTALEGPLEQKLLAEGVTCYRIPMRHPFDARAARLLAGIVKKERVSVVHAHYLRENYIAVLSRAFGSRAPVIWTYHVDVPVSPMVKRLNRVVTAGNAMVIAVSHYMRNKLLEYGVPAGRIRVIYNGVRVQAGEPDRRESHTATGPEQRPVVLGVVGRLSEEKGHRFLIEGLLRLRLNRAWVCRIAGTGPMESELKQTVRAYGLSDRVSFVGYVDNIAAFLRDVDMVVIPSRSEALSYTAIEALAMERPVVATRVGGLPEVIHHEETGLLVPYGDAQALADAVARLVRNPAFARSLGSRGRRLYESKFTIERMMKEIRQVYDAVSSDREGRE
ncbi:MAG: glycosyltransferase family 4 protein [Alicyclobacillaceae bacterium]|nr:glycosyltransferase family 4 protein [Alicyclobacillaceae bacterium]